MPTCTVMVGLPATGKSTRVRELSTMNPDVFVYSTDNLLEEWAAEEGKTYNEVFNDLIDNATREMNRLLDSAIRNRLDIVWDQTNLSVSKRAKIIRRMRNADYHVECECIVPPEAGWLDDQKTWKHRLDIRAGKTIPASVLKSMNDNFVKPTVEEGFDAVHYFNMHGHLIDPKLVD